MCICAAYTTPLEGVAVFTEAGLPEWESLRQFLEGRGVLFTVHECSAAERQRRFGTADRPVTVIGRHVLAGFDPAALLPLLP